MIRQNKSSPLPRTLSTVVLLCMTLVMLQNTSDSTAAQTTNKPAHNRLINESSPYLLQHATNPIDWYPWGPEAFDKAQKDFEMASKAAAHSYEKGRDKFMEKIVDSETEIEKSGAKKKESPAVSDKKESV